MFIIDLQRSQTQKKIMNAATAEAVKDLNYALRPVMKSLRLVGMLYVHTDNQIQNFSSKLFIGIVSCFHLFNTVRMFLMYDKNDKFGPWLMIKLIQHAWVIQVSVAVVMTLQVSLRYQSGCFMWGEYKGAAPANTNLVVMRRRAVFSTSFVWTMSLIFVAVQVYSTLTFGSPVTEVWLMPFWEPGKAPTGVKIASTFFYFIFTSSWMMPMLLLGNFVLGMRDDFIALNNEMQASLSLTSGHINIEHFRCRHRELSHLISYLDCAFSVYNLSVFVINIPVTCALIYCIINTEYSAETSVAYMEGLIKGIIACVMYMMVLTAFGTVLNNAVSTFVLIPVFLYDTFQNTNFIEIKLFHTRYHKSMPTIISQRDHIPELF